MPLGGKQPRGIVVGELGGRTHVFVGTACGVLVAQELELVAATEPPGPRAPHEGLRLLSSVCYQARALQSCHPLPARSALPVNVLPMWA